MPELPDLQVFSRNLNKLLAGKVLVRTKITKEKLRKPPTPKLKLVTGERLVSIERVGMYSLMPVRQPLRLDLADQYSVFGILIYIQIFVRGSR